MFQLGFTIEQIDVMIDGFKDGLSRLNKRLDGEKADVKKTEMLIAESQQKLNDLEASRAVLQSVQLTANAASTKIADDINGNGDPF